MTLDARGNLLPPVGFVTVAAMALLLTGCDGQGGTAAPTGTSGTLPTGQTTFDPCTSLTPQFLSEHQWDAQPPAPKQNTAAGIAWKGCRYVAKAGYGFTIETTNGTLDQVRQKFPAAAEISVSGRKALRYEARPDVPGGCTVNVELTSGSLYVLVDDPSGKHPRKLPPCDNATEIAQAVAPLLPEGS